MDNTITFNKQVINDAFVDMPLSSQLFYFYLLMNADREGFVGNPKALQRVTGAKECDMEILSEKGFVRVFPSGIIIISHWRIHNNIQNKNKEINTLHIQEMNMISINQNNVYVFKDTQKEQK